MFPKFFTPNKFVMSAIVVFMVLLAQSVFAISSLPPAFDRIAARETYVPEQLNNTVCYQIAYYKQMGNVSMRVYPTVEERQRDSDLILAHVVQKYLDEVYEAQGKYMDEHVVEDADLGQILDLVGQNFVSKAWKNDDVNFLRQYIRKDQKNSLLYTLHIYLDHYVDSETSFTGMDKNPIILHFSDEKKSDMATFIAVNFTDK